MEKHEVRLSGSGGQGLILAGIILAEAAIIDGKNAVQTQSYGPEARGGASKSEVLISDEAIDFPKVRICDVLLALTLKSYEQYKEGLREDGILIIDSSVKVTETLKNKIFSIPIIDTASKVLGKPMVTNIVALGAIVEITNLVSHDALEAAVLKRVPTGTEDLNKKALALGIEIAKNAKLSN